MEMNLENTITVLETMRMICGLCRTEKEALESAVSYLKTIQEENEEED
jgi:hypothetical protein